MKKYVKPDVFFESFELSQSIAVCGWDMNATDKNTCTALGDESQGNIPVKMFTETPRCDGDESAFEKYCYEPGSGANALFNS